MPSSHVDAQRRTLLEGPILSSVLRLSAPNALNFAALTVLVSADVFFLGPLGPGTLAGVALVFPLKMLMQHVSSAGVGAAVAAAVARALGGGDRERAQGLAVVAVLVALVGAAATTAVMLGLGPSLYRYVDHRADTIEVARVYSTVIFGGALTPWLFNILASVVRGTGNMIVPSVAIALCAIAEVALAPSLIFGLGPFPRLGVAGAGLSYILAFGLGSVALASWVFSRGSAFAIGTRLPRLRLQWFREVLAVGLPASMSPAVTNITVVLLTGLVATHGPIALAAYGVAVRLEYIIIPVASGVGTALVTLVAMNLGAGDRVRAASTARVGVLVAGTIAGIIGGATALWPAAWMKVFSHDPAVLVAGAAYLHVVGPCYALFAMSVALFFAAQAFGRPTWAVLANVLRMGVAVGGGWLLTHILGSGLAELFGVIAVAYVCQFALTTGAALRGGWRAH